MFCPICRDEFRPGFTRCEGCDAELVEQLDSGSKTGTFSGSLAPDMSGPKADYCGFLEMTEAREARDLLWDNGILSEIAIRPVAGCLPGNRLKEEFWLRVPAKQVQVVIGLLGFDEHTEGGSETGERQEGRRCAGCGADLPGQERFCPHCGAGD